MPKIKVLFLSTVQKVDINHRAYRYVGAINLIVMKIIDYKQFKSFMD